MTDLDVIKNQIDIVDLISNTAPLKKAGKYYKSNCPFHQEKTPSFIVDDVRQTWRCYGACSMGGDIFSFVMKAENIEFVEALHVLAETAGIQLESQEKVSDKGSLFDITLLAQKFFQDYKLDKSLFLLLIYSPFQELVKLCFLWFQVGEKEIKLQCRLFLGLLIYL